MEAKANRIILKTHTEYAINHNDGTKTYFFLDISEGKPLICSEEITPENWGYLCLTYKGIEEIGTVVCSPEYPDGYLDVNPNELYYIEDGTNIIMPSELYYLDYDAFSDYIDKKHQKITILGHQVTLTSELLESLEIWHDVYEDFQKDIINGKNPDFAEMFSGESEQVKKWQEENEQVPVPVVVRNNKAYLLSESRKIEKQTNDIMDYFISELDKFANYEKVPNTSEMWEYVQAILSE